MNKPLPPPPKIQKSRPKSKRLLCQSQLLPLAFLITFLLLVLGAFLKPELWERKDFVALASATLTGSLTLSRNND